jgi:hypothetical protein
MEALLRRGFCCFGVVAAASSGAVGTARGYHLRDQTDRSAADGTRSKNLAPGMRKDRNLARHAISRISSRLRLWHAKRMTLLREIQHAATEDQVRVSVLLRKAQVLAARLDHEPLRQWTRLELDGYERSEDLPDYRRLGRVNVLGHFSGPFNSGMSNAPIPRTHVPEEWRDVLFTHDMFESVAALESFAASPEAMVQYSWPAEVVASFANCFYEGQNCMQAFKVVPTTQIVSVLDTVRNRLLDFALSIEQLDPDAGDGEGQSSATPAAITQIFNNTITGGHVAFASSGQGSVSQLVSQRTDGMSSLETLRVRLQEWGVPEDDLHDLDHALDADREAEAGVGPETQRWLGRLAGKVGAGSVRLAEGVGIELIAGLLGRAASG